MRRRRYSVLRWTILAAALITCLAALGYQMGGDLGHL